MSTYTYVRFWCVYCLCTTSHRRYGGADIANAKLECAECGPHAKPPIDWVQVACES